MQLTLLVLAAGMGSRYGGLKQIDPIGPSGEIIIDYSIHDAIASGFNHIVFVIRKSFDKDFKEAIGDRISKLVDVSYAYQEMDCDLDGYKPDDERVKPWGTGHAILVADEVIDGPFAVINADDYYGRHAFEIMAKQLSEMNEKEDLSFCMAGYKLENTLSEYGTVSRGVCTYNDHQHLTNVQEYTKLKKTDSGAVDLDDKAKPEFTGKEIVSMNLWGFTPVIFDHLHNQFKEFLQLRGQELKSEFFIPSVVDRLIKEKGAEVTICPTHESWFGITYKEDKALAQQHIAKLVENKTYPERLWK